MASDDPDRLRRETVGFDPADGCYHVPFDRTGGTSLSYAVLRTVAAVTGQEPHELGPLPEVVDPDALEALFDGAADDVTLDVSLEGCRVTIYAHGRLVVEPPPA